MEITTQVVKGFLEWLRYHPDNPLSYNEIAEKIKVKPQLVYDITSGRRTEIPNPIVNRIRLNLSDEIDMYMDSRHGSDTKIAKWQRELNKDLIKVNTMWINFSLRRLKDLNLLSDEMKAVIMELQNEKLYTPTRIELNNRLMELIKKALTNLKKEK